jgi:hypothetical protein
MNELTKFLVESILQESAQYITVLMPGGFKPPHGGHLDLAKRYASLPEVGQVKVLIGPKEREGVTRDESVKIWSLLTSDIPKIIVESVAEDNPLLAAYKYMERAQPGTYALAASSKGDDYKRVKQFTAGHNEGGKYYKKDVVVEELPLDVAPLLYTGRTDGLDGKGISASTLRSDIIHNDYKNFKTNYPGIPEEKLKVIFSILTKKPVKETNLLTEGGAAGHMTHPYEDMELSFENIKNIIDTTLSGKVEFAQEKLDGQNLMVTYKDGQVRAARNKGQIKNYGANSLTLKQVDDMFAGRGPIQKAFTEAMRDLETAINRLSTSQKKYFFDNGKRFLNLEVLFPATANVVPYGATQLRLHNIRTYDEAGNVVGEDSTPAKQLEGALRQIEAQNQKTYEIRVSDPATIKKSADYDKQREELLQQLKTLQSKYKLQDSDTIGTYIEKWWSNFITQKAKSYTYRIPQNVVDMLVARWGFSNKETNIKNIRAQIDNGQFSDWVAEFDKSEVNKFKKTAVNPVEMLFLKLGVFVLKNVENLVSLNPDDSVRAIKGELKASIEKIKQAARTPEGEDDKASLEFLKRELGRLRDIGGFKAIVPTEGIVFKYGGKLYKLTGSFAPINQIIGYMRF